MKEFEDVSEMLVEEVLSDMANTFFGSRVDLDDMMEVFGEYVEQLKRRQDHVDSRAGLLNTLLIDSNTAKDFYSDLGIDPKLFYGTNEYTPDVLPENKPFSLTGKGEYVKFVVWAYDAFQQAVRAYLRGGRDGGEKKNEALDSNYAMLEHMSKLINKEVKKVNRMSPICTIQYTRQFKPEILEKEKITGTGFADYGCDNLDRNMSFKPIDFDGLNFKNYPEPPKLDTVKPQVVSLAKKIYETHSGQAKKRLARLRKSMCV